MMQAESLGNRMKIPDYPSNREADKKQNVTALGREDALKGEAKSGNLLTHLVSSGIEVKLCMGQPVLRLQPLLILERWFYYLYCFCSFAIMKRRKYK